MKGVVFTEFMTMVEDVFSPETLDLIIERSELPNHGAYTSVGTYDHQEIVRMTVNLSEHLNIPVPDLLESFGRFLFVRFTEMFPAFFKEPQHAFDFLKKVDLYIHVEVKKLYPDAELPRFYYEQTDEQSLVLYYVSSRHLQDLAIGLIKGCLDYYQNPAVISHEATTYEKNEATKITIVLQHT
jgi:hypothetical protein